MSTTVPELNIDDIIGSGGLYAVIAYNNDYTPIDFVISVLINHARKSNEEAMFLANSIHVIGSAEVFIGSFDECENLVNRFDEIKVYSIIETQ